MASLSGRQAVGNDLVLSRHQLPVVPSPRRPDGQAYKERKIVTPWP